MGTPDRRLPGRARSSDGIPITYEVAGSREPTLVLVHGWAFDRRLWDDHVARLAARHRVITLDLPGHGETGGRRPDWTMAAFGEDVKTVADAAGVNDIVLVGHSMGGPVVLEAARRMPGRVRGIVLVDTVLNVEERMPAEQIEVIARQLEADYRATATQMATEYLFAPATPASVRERVLRQVTAIAPDVSIALLRQVWAYNPAPALREISAPVRAVNADKFPTHTETNRRYMSGFEAQIVAGTGHYPMLEAPERFATALDRAIEQVIAPSAGGRSRPS